MPNAAATRTGFAPAMRPGTFASAAPLMPMKAAMMTSGMRIEMIVRGWRSRRDSETCSAVISSSGSTGAGRGPVGGLGVGACRDRVQAGADLHRSGRYRVARSTRHRPKVLPTGIAHRGRPSGEPARPASGLTRPLPRVRWTSLATGVHRRTK